LPSSRRPSQTTDRAKRPRRQSAAAKTTAIPAVKTVKAVKASAAVKAAPRVRRPKTQTPAPAIDRPAGWRVRLAIWYRRLRLAGRLFAAVPPPFRTLLLLILAAVLLVAATFGYHVLKKPTEMLFPVSGVLKKRPVETWEQYGPLFRKYSTTAVSPELLAALAQVEGAGDPIAHTYWRWRRDWNPLTVYAPASSAVGMYQMTDPTFADARHYCIRNHHVEREADGWDSCWFTGLYSRILPAHAVELTAISLDRSVNAVLGRHGPIASLRQKEDLAAITHLCGAGAARLFADRGFRLVPGEHCGDHEAAFYVAQVHGLIKVFQRLEAQRAGKAAH
jgi:hypothetical protein